jgi:hypothetical protein
MSQPLSKPGIGHNAAPALESERTDREGAVDYDDGLLAVAGPIMISAYAGALTIASFTFFGSGDALFAVVISVAFAVMYFMLPLLMRRVRNVRDRRWDREMLHATSPTVICGPGPSVVGKASRRLSACRSQFSSALQPSP